MGRLRPRFKRRSPTDLYDAALRHPGEALRPWLGASIETAGLVVLQPGRQPVHTERGVPVPGLVIVAAK